MQGRLGQGVVQRVGRGRQVQLPDQARQVLRRRLPARLGDHQAEQDVVRVVVLRLLVRRRELRSVGADDRQRVVVGPRHRGLGEVAVEERLVVGEVVAAAAHGEQVPDGDRVAVGDVGDVTRDGVGERDLALVDEPQHRVRRERLGDAGDAVMRVGTQRCARRVRAAVRLQERAARRVDDAHHRPGHPVHEALRGGVVDAGQLVRGEAGRRRRGRRRGGRLCGSRRAGRRAGGERQHTGEGGQDLAAQHHLSTSRSGWSQARLRT